MAASTEQIAFWILAALKEEWERDPSHSTCRPESVVLGALKTQHKIEDADITRGIRYLIDRRALDAVNRKDGRATLPNTIGLEILAEHHAAQKREAERKQSARWTIYAVVISLIGLVLTYLAYRSR